MKGMYYLLKKPSFGLLLLFVASLLLFSGCATFNPPSYQPSIENVQELRSFSEKCSLAVGTFTVADPNDRKFSSLNIRTNTFKPKQGNFGEYLGEAVKTDLQNGGCYDPKSSQVLSGILVDHKVLTPSSGFAEASITAQFFIKKKNQVVYDREIIADHKWEGVFLGAIAIPEAMENYSVTLKKLLANLFADPDFRRAAKP
jgi:hypothetical protein